MKRRIRHDQDTVDWTIFQADIDRVLDLSCGIALPNPRWSSYRAFLQTYRDVRRDFLQLPGAARDFCEVLHRAVRRFGIRRVEELGARLWARQHDPRRDR